MPSLRAPELMGVADLHAHTRHTRWSDGNQTVQQLLGYVQEKTDLDLFAITDHDSTDAARFAWELHQAGDYRFSFLPGVEVTNQAGHLLIYFPRGNIVDVPSLRPFWWTVQYAHEHGAVCIPAHPVYPPWLLPLIRRGLNQGTRLDALEVVNAGVGARAQEHLDRLACEFHSHIALVGNSDAHHQSAIGAAYTTFPGRSVEDFLAALHNRRTEPVFLRRPRLDRTARRFTTRRSMTRPGWVGNLWREIRNNADGSSSSEGS